VKEGMKILVGVDGSDNSTWALMEAISIAKKFSGHVKVITVHERANEKEAIKTQIKAKKLLDEVEIDSSLELILGSHPSKEIVDVAKKENFNLIVVGSRGLGNLATFLIGSISKVVVNKSNCNVLVVKK
jgi:nucleotide-binding universal stress UspA family protein